MLVKGNRAKKVSVWIFIFIFKCISCVCFVDNSYLPSSKMIGVERTDPGIVWVGAGESDLVEYLTPEESDLPVPQYRYWTFQPRHSLGQCRSWRSQLRRNIWLRRSQTYLFLHEEILHDQRRIFYQGNKRIWRSREITFLDDFICSIQGLPGKVIKRATLRNYRRGSLWERLESS